MEECCVLCAMRAMCLCVTFMCAMCRVLCAHSWCRVLCAHILCVLTWVGV